jgi:hypothetical protein
MRVARNADVQDRATKVWGFWFGPAPEPVFQLFIT